MQVRLNLRKVDSWYSNLSRIDDAILSNRLVLGVVLLLKLIDGRQHVLDPLFLLGLWYAWTRDWRSQLGNVHHRNSPAGRNRLLGV